MTLPLVPYRAFHLVGCQSRWLCWEPVRWDYLSYYELEWIAAFEETCKEPAVEANPFHWSVKTGTSLTVRPPLGRKRLEGFVFQNIKELWRNKKLWVIFLHLFCSSFSCPIGIRHFLCLSFAESVKHVHGTTSQPCACIGTNELLAKLAGFRVHRSRHAFTSVNNKLHLSPISGVFTSVFTSCA